MKHHRNRVLVRGLLLAVVVAGTILVSGLSGATASGKGYYKQTNLVSDVKGKAKFTDPNLVNPWGLSRSNGSPWWVSDNGTGVSTLYEGDGTAASLVVTIPASSPAASGTPTGQVFNSTGQFEVGASPAVFIFDSEDGTISGWNGASGTSASIQVNSVDAVYKGLAIGSVGSVNYLYATNFRSGKIDMFNSNFELVSQIVDTKIPSGYAPFGIQSIGGMLYVTYAKQDSNKHDAVPGRGHGFVDVFNTDGAFIKRLAARGVLNSPWGLALAPRGFGRFSKDLLVGNLGDGRVSAFNAVTGKYLGQLQGKNGHAKSIPGLRGLAFGNDGKAGNSKALYFTAGPDHKSHGLFGTLTNVKP
jgi:uncharacterized protein (TIGR03118 family)